MVIREDRGLILTFFLTVLLVVSGCHRQEIFYSDVASEKKPWTHLQFKNSPEAFQFAVVSDNTGGSRERVFSSAVGKLNLLQPEFVISIGDLIEGYTEDTDVLKKRWAEFGTIVGLLEMPFFYAPGNHDVTNLVMTKLWEEKFGRRYYSFVYRDVLFMVLDTQDGGLTSQKPYRTEAGLSEAQLAWAQTTLAANSDVRYTMIFMHQPLWVYEKGSLGQATFSEVESAMEDRDYMVFCGHSHRYTHYHRNHHVYVSMATTGGGSQLRGLEYGEFDHTVWVTMTENGPQIANLLLDGIQPVDVFDEEDLRKLQHSP